MRPIKRCIFLDIDDVIRVWRVEQYEASGVFTEPNWTCFLEMMQAVPDVDVVILSSWKDHQSLDEIREKFGNAGFDSARIVGSTPGRRLDVIFESRGQQVKAWLEAHPQYEQFMIVDDAPLDHFDTFFDESLIIQPDMNTGLTKDEVVRAIAFFKGLGPGSDLTHDSAQLTTGT